LPNSKRNISSATHPCSSILHRGCKRFHRHGLDYRYEKLDSEASPNHVALDETVIRINDQQYWLYAAVDPEMNNFSTFGSLRPIRLVLPKPF
jgi:transposase-like protein